MLRMPWSQGMHWALRMVVEDGLSLLSFVLGLLYLHFSDGAPLRLLVKCVAATSVGDSAVEVEIPTEGTDSAPQRPMRLFYFAM